jgi:hypothetical protein
MDWWPARGTPRPTPMTEMDSCGSTVLAGECTPRVSSVAHARTARERGRHLGELVGVAAVGGVHDVCLNPWSNCCQLRMANLTNPCLGHWGRGRFGGGQRNRAAPLWQLTEARRRSTRVREAWHRWGVWWGGSARLKLAAARGRATARRSAWRREGSRRGSRRRTWVSAVGRGDGVEDVERAGGKAEKCRSGEGGRCQEKMEDGVRGLDPQPHCTSARFQH